MSDKKLPEKKSTTDPVTKADRKGVDAFLQKVAATPKTAAQGERGRLMFCMDATASREPTWDRAAHLQAEMFTTTRDLGGLAVQLVFFRGFGEFKTTKWLTDDAELLRLMTSVTCLAGETQLGKVLKHAINETKAKRVNALVYVGDCCEEDVDRLGKLAGELGLLGVPCFVFHEGNDPIGRYVFQQVAKLSGGAYCPFNAASKEILRELLGAVAVFAAGGHKALEHRAKQRGGETLMIADQMRR